MLCMLAKSQGTSSRRAQAPRPLLRRADADALTCTASSSESSSTDMSANSEHNSATGEQAQGTEAESSASAQTAAADEQPRRRGQKRQADSTDWISSQLTRRFGLAGGLVYLGFLTFSVVSEQVKTRLEVAADERGTMVGQRKLPSLPGHSLCLT